MKSVREQFNEQLFAFTKDYDEVLPYLNSPFYEVRNTYHSNGLFNNYYIGMI
ncbi:MAG: hypothetical protein K6D91_06130 [Prevotella sp.]|nr:hypothetical protein [Prevotella sp.]